MTTEHRTRRVELTGAARRQLEALPLVEKAAAARMLEALPTTRARTATKLGPAPFGEGDLLRFRAGRVRVLATADETTFTVVGFGLRRP